VSVDDAWCEDYLAVVQFGQYLAEQFDGEADGLVNLQRYYAKPWHWSTERAAWRLAIERGNLSPDLESLYEDYPEDAEDAEDAEDEVCPPTEPTGGPQCPQDR
jgi:hypothetical protein